MIVGIYNYRVFSCLFKDIFTKEFIINFVAILRIVKCVGP